LLKQYNKITILSIGGNMQRYNAFENNIYEDDEGRFVEYEDYVAACKELFKWWKDEARLNNTLREQVEILTKRLEIYECPICKEPQQYCTCEV
jgi:hypothetical protein